MDPLRKIYESMPHLNESELPDTVYQYSVLSIEKDGKEIQFNFAKDGMKGKSYWATTKEKAANYKKKSRDYVLLTLNLKKLIEDKPNFKVIQSNDEFSMENIPGGYIKEKIA